MHGLALAFGGLSGAILLAPAMAQTPVEAAQTKERVEITGSLLRRASTETALPITTLNMDDLKKAGVTTAEQAGHLHCGEPEPGGIATRSRSAESTAGRPTPTCADLDPTRTLVLLNGQRVVNNPYSKGLRSI